MTVTTNLALKDLGKQILETDALILGKKCVKEKGSEKACEGHNYALEVVTEACVKKIEVMANSKFNPAIILYEIQLSRDQVLAMSSVSLFRKAKKTYANHLTTTL